MKNNDIKMALYGLKGILVELKEQEPERYKTIQSLTKKIEKLNDNSEEAKIALTMVYFEMMSKETA
jgi:hypothetical protein